MTGFNGPDIGAGVQTFLEKVIGLRFREVFHKVAYRKRQSSLSGGAGVL
jgi:hypothetical protein